MDSGELLSPAQDGGAAATSDDSANDIRRIPGTGCSFANEQIHAVATVSYDQGDRQLLQRLTNSARDLSHERTLFKEIERLAGTILTIDVSFYEITRGLRSLTGKIRGNDTLLPVCSVLLGQWSQHHKECSIQVGKSNRKRSDRWIGVQGPFVEVKRNAQGVVDEFRVHVLPFLRDHAIPVAEKQRTIAHQIEVVDRNALRSQKQSQNFKDFSEALKTYVAEFSDEVESLDLDDQNDKVRSLNKELRRAKNAMDVIQKEIQKVALALAGNVVITGVALWLATMAPRWWFVAIGTAGDTFLGTDPLGANSSWNMLCDALKRRQMATFTYESVKLGRDKEQTNLNQMTRLVMTLNKSELIVQEMCEKLCIFVSVWNFITADLRQIQHGLGYTVTNSTSSVDFMNRIERLETLYEYLSKALRHYQVVTQT